MSYVFPVDRKHELLNKLQMRIITPAEAEELRGVMMREAQAAKATEDLLKLFVIIGILALIAAVLANLSKK